MKILIPILGFGRHGGYRVLSELANAWIRLGIDCSFLSPSASADPYYPTTARVIRVDRAGRQISGISQDGGSGRTNILSLFCGMNRHGKDYDVIFANHSLTAWPAWLARCGEARKFYYIQAYEPDYYPILRDPVKYLLSKNSYILPLKQIANASIYSGRGIQPVEVIPPGIDLSIFSRKIGGVFDPNSSIPVVLGTIGRAEPYKGTARVVEVYRRIRKTFPGIQMRVALGNVPASEDLEIMPVRNDSELSAFYRSVDILICGGVIQFGAPHYPVIEAMASGTPVVHCGYFPGSPENSWVAKEPTEDGLLAALTELLGSDANEIAKRVDRARSLIESDLAWDRVALRFIETMDA